MSGNKPSLIDYMLGEIDFTTVHYAVELRKNIDFLRYVKLIARLGNSLDEPKNRFDKADIIEQSIEIYSNGKLKWVDEIGVDHIDIATQYRIEFKFISYGMYTENGKRKSHAMVKLKNWNGSGTTTSGHRSLPNSANYYMLGQENALALISYDDILPYCFPVDDGIKAKIPLECLEFIFSPIDAEVRIESDNEFHYVKQKRKMQREFIESI